MIKLAFYYFLICGISTYIYFSDTGWFLRLWSVCHKGDKDYEQKYNVVSDYLDMLEYGRPFTELVCLLFGWLLFPILICKTIFMLLKWFFKIK